MVFVVCRSVTCKPITIECSKDDMPYCSITSFINLTDGDTLHILNANRSWNSINTIFEIQPQQRSYITSIDSIFNYFPALEQLFISNSFDELPSMQFTAPTVRSINFRKNFIRTIKKTAFDGATNVEHIDLTDNLIHLIENEALNGLDHLMSIRIANNRLGSLLQHTFDGAKSLSYINLRNNSIAMITAGCFALPNLEELILAENHLEIVPADIFNRSERLKKVSFAHNRIKVISIIAVAQKAPIEMLSFEDNQLGKYEQQTIHCKDTLNYHLKHLNLASNQLHSVLMFDSLKCLPNLEMLNLNRNNFTQFYDIRKIRLYFPHLTIVHLIDNKINCKWLNRTAFDTSLFFTRPNRKFTIKRIACIP